jgi:hypothetical protein
MKQIENPDIAQLRELAANAIPQPRQPLKGQGEIALLLAKRGFGPTGIARFLAEHGKPVSVPTVSKFLKRS